MHEAIKMPPHEGEPDSPLSVPERILAQAKLLEILGKPTEKEREDWMEESSGPFRKLEEDPEFRRLIREGNFEEALARLEAFKKEQKEKQEKTA
ncbi:MAG: hypothetical protein V2A55_03705 [Candidatus Jorgensenbacteria bacterium]